MQSYEFRMKNGECEADAGVVREQSKGAMQGGGLNS
jgi:hypothetical protein